MSLASQRLSQLGDVSLASMGEAAGDVWDLSKSHTATSFIEEQHWTEYSDQIQELFRQSRVRHKEESGAQLLSEVQSDLGVGLEGGGNGMLIAMWGTNRKGKPVGHALLAYDVEISQSEPGADFIDVYDSNVPYTTRLNNIGPDEESVLGAAHQARNDISRLKIASDGSWSYPAAGLGGTAGALAFLPFDLITREIDHGLTFGGAGTADITLSPSTTLSSLIAPSGQPVTVNGQGSSGVLFGTATDGVSDSSSFSGPPGSYHEVLSGASSISKSWSRARREGSLDLSSGTRHGHARHDRGHGRGHPGPHGHGSAHATLTLFSGQGANAGAVIVSGPEGHGLTLALVGSTATLTAPSGGTYMITDSSSGSALAGAVTLAAGDRATLFAQSGALRARVRHADRPHTITIGHRQEPRGATITHLTVHARIARVTTSTPPLPTGSTVTLYIALTYGGKFIKLITFPQPGSRGSRTLTVQLPSHLPTHATVTVTATAISQIAATIPTTATSTTRPEPDDRRGGRSARVIAHACAGS